MDEGGIHEEHPFLTPIEDRDPARRLRGRLTAPVTIVTAGAIDDRSGLTVSSILVAEGDPPLVYLLISSTCDLWYAIEESGRFVVHIATSEHREAADIFAGIRPAPGGVFAGRDVEQSQYGPVLNDFVNRAFCTLLEAREESHSLLVSARIDTLDLEDLVDPLAYFRGRYRLLD